MSSVSARPVTVRCGPIASTTPGRTRCPGDWGTPRGRVVTALQVAMQPPRHGMAVGTASKSRYSVTVRSTPMLHRTDSDVKATR